MLHVIWTQGNRVDSWLLVVRSQIANLTSGPSFGNNFCFRYPNGSCEPMLDIYVSIAFQWYKKLLNPLNFGPSFSLWTFGSPSGLQLPRWSSLGSVRVHSFTLSFTLGLPLLARNLASPCFGREPKVRVATFILQFKLINTKRKILFSHLFWLDSHLFYRSDCKQNKFECVFYQLNYFCGQVLELCLDWPQTPHLHPSIYSKWDLSLVVFVLFLDPTGLPRFLTTTKGSWTSGVSKT